jgi:shikimate kinase
MTQDSRKKNIILIGMPGSGKTTIGKLLAEKLNRVFMDSDQLIIQKTGKTPRQIVEFEGRAVFLDAQDSVILEIECDDFVLATGGGIVHSELAMNRLKSLGCIIYLNASYKIIEERMDKTRKLVRTNGGLQDLYNERAPLYLKYADKILDCDNIEPQLLCEKIIVLMNSV